MKISYRQMMLEDCGKMFEIDASQYIGRAWRDVGGSRQLVTIDYHDSTWPNGEENHYKKLIDTVHTSGDAFGAYDEDNRLLGFGTVNRMGFGQHHAYALLDQLFITSELRGKGIGKQLFLLCADRARSWACDKLYICAGSAEETIGFYEALGCVDAEEVNQTFYDSDPRDLQLEYRLIR
jgi:GNAT superfamily N-acetyltransferase